MTNYVDLLVLIAVLQVSLVEAARGATVKSDVIDGLGG